MNLWPGRGSTHHYTKPYCSACKQLPCPIHSPFTIRGGILESCSGDSLHWFCTPAAVTSRFNSGGLVGRERGGGRSFRFVQRSLRLAQRWPACTVQRSTFHWWIDRSWQAVNTRGEGIASGWVTFLFDFISHEMLLLNQTPSVGRRCFRLRATTLRGSWISEI